MILANPRLAPDRNDHLAGSQSALDSMALRSGDVEAQNRQAEEQSRGVEGFRLEAAERAFGSDPVALKG